ncbi:MAG: hypothetical protein K2N86_00645, partial [Rikenellaceae bacterium]|nr:hypothetical protein [Rikenellaceae bacterium]
MVEQEAAPAINTDPGEALEIFGLIWSKYNLANPKQASGGATFATKLPSECSGVRQESHGKLYQWGINVGWSSTGESTPDSSWDTSNAPSSWTVQPCPGDYRLPTADEFQVLLNNCITSKSGGWHSSDCGYFTLTLKTDSSKKVEFPAAGEKIAALGLGNQGFNGRYWTTDVYIYDSNNASNLYVSEDGIRLDNAMKKRAYSVRCVKGAILTKDDPGETMNIGDVEWTQYNLANPQQAAGGATFAAKLPSQCSGTRAESHGKFYQFGFAVSWNATGESASGAIPSNSWVSSTYRNKWDNPCPDGYRVPSDADFQNLINNTNATYMSGAWSADNYGFVTLTSKSNSYRKLEFPAVGFRNGEADGKLVSPGTQGNYWTSVPVSSYNANCLSFNDRSMSVSDNKKLSGYNVRCVKMSDRTIDYTELVKIGSVEWMQVNLVNPRQASGGATFATKLPSECIGVRTEAHGKFYQWGVNVAWYGGDSTPNGTWNTSNYGRYSWETTPCPLGYRLPTSAEFQDLANNTTLTYYNNALGWSATDNHGYITLTSKTDATKKLEFIAGGDIINSDLSVRTPGVYGNYWSSSVESEQYRAYYLEFNLNSVNFQQSNSMDRAYYVRCVKGNAQNVEEVYIQGLAWNKYNLANPKQASG